MCAEFARQKGGDSLEEEDGVRLVLPVERHLVEGLGIIVSRRASCGKVPGLGYRASGFGLESRVWGLEVKVWGLGFGV